MEEGAFSRPRRDICRVLWTEMLIGYLAKSQQKALSVILEPRGWIDSSSVNRMKSHESGSVRLPQTFE